MTKHTVVKLRSFCDRDSDGDLEILAGLVGLMTPFPGTAVVRGWMDRCAHRSARYEARVGVAIVINMEVAGLNKNSAHSYSQSKCSSVDVVLFQPPQPVSRQPRSCLVEAAVDR